MAKSRHTARCLVNTIRLNGARERRHGPEMMWNFGQIENHLDAMLTLFG
jgi:hypothetical protein